jgi:LacI family kdg operon repressor
MLDIANFRAKVLQISAKEATMAKAARATISDVAKAAKTGKTSISRYLNGEKHLLSDDLLARIEKAIAELDYRPSLMARGLKHGRTRLIGLIIADITNPYSVNVLSGIEAACREKGFTLLVCNTNNELDQELHYLDLLRSYQVEGSWSTRSGCARMA